MCAYSQRYKCPDVIMLYPQQGGEPITSTFIVSDDTKLHIRTVDLTLDLQSTAGKIALKERLGEILEVRAC